MHGCLIVTVTTGHQQHRPAEHKSPSNLVQKKPPRVLLYHLPAQPRPDINLGWTTVTGACFKMHCIGAVLVIQGVACTATFQSTCLILPFLSKDFPWSPCLWRHPQFATASIFLLRCPVFPLQCCYQINLDFSGFSSNFFVFFLIGSREDSLCRLDEDIVSLLRTLLDPILCAVCPGGSW